MKKTISTQDQLQTKTGEYIPHLLEKGIKNRAWETIATLCPRTASYESKITFRKKRQELEEKFLMDTHLKVRVLYGTKTLGGYRDEPEMDSAEDYQQYRAELERAELERIHGSAEGANLAAQYDAITKEETL